MSNFNIKWNSALINKVISDFDNFCDSENISEGIATIAENKIAEILSGYSQVGLHTAYALYDEQTELYDTPLNLHVFVHCAPFFKVLSDEFSDKLHYTKEYDRNSGATGASKSVAEDSPISTETIETDEEASFSAEYPNASTRAGNQYSNKANSHDIVNDPRIEKEVIEFNVFGLNLTRICEKICRALTKEYIDVY